MKQWHRGRLFFFYIQREHSDLDFVHAILLGCVVWGLQSSGGCLWGGSVKSATLVKLI